MKKKRFFKFYHIFICMAIYSYCNGQESIIKNFIFYSKSLDESRSLTVYFPENFNLENYYNVIICTDGQLINELYKYKLDSIFSNNRISPFVIIGVNSNERIVQNSYLEYRNFEYLENMQSDDSDLNSRFERHLNFFVNEVNEYIKEELNLKINSKFFYGVSNGAAFGVSIAKYYHELFSKYILYSMAGENYKNLKRNHSKYPFFIIRYGNNEAKSLIKNNKKFSKYLTAKRYQHIMKSYKGGHNREDWLNLFIMDIENL